MHIFLTFSVLCILYFFYLSLSLSLIISFSFLMLNENFLCCLQFFICRDPTFIPKGLERIQKNKHYCGTSVIMQTSCFRFLVMHFIIGIIFSWTCFHTLCFETIYFSVFMVDAGYFCSFLSSSF